MCLKEIRCPSPYDVMETELLGIILRSGYEAQEGWKFLTEGHEPIQAGILKVESRSIVSPHLHDKYVRSIQETQEVIVIRKGEAKVDFYSTDEKYYATEWLWEGDVVILLRGGHGMQLSEGCEILEIKNGPYLGRDTDKRYI